LVPIKRCPEATGRVAVTARASALAGRIWRKYRQQGGPRSRFLSDFLIGAHAQVQTNRLVSRDRGFYRKLFPTLTVLDPSRRVL